jgi:hypothetical protein
MSDKRLSKLYKWFLSRPYGVPFSNGGHSIIPWIRREKNKVLKINTITDNKKIIVRDKIVPIITYFYQKVIEQGVLSPGRFELLFLGYMHIVELNPITGRPRHIPTIDDDKYEEVVEDYFTKRTKYQTLFTINRKKIKVSLRDFISSGVHEQANNKIVKQAYKLHPFGKFYRSNTK